MDPHSLQHAASRAGATPAMNRLLGAMSIATMAMTIPQIWVIWVGHQTAGVSIWTWGTYFLSSVLWLVHGLARHDRNVYLACIGWLILDLAVIAGLLVNK